MESRNGTGAEVKSSFFESYPNVNNLVRAQLVGRSVTDVFIGKDSSVIALDNGVVLEVPGFFLEFDPIDPREPTALHRPGLAT